MTSVDWPWGIDVGDGIALRGPDPHDAEGLVAAIDASLEELRPWMAWAAAPATLDQQAVRLAVAAEAFSIGADASYTVVVDGEVAGVIGIHDRLGDDTARELGYWLATEHSGRGVMTRSIVAVLAVVASLGFDRAVIHCDEQNHRSAGVARRAGFTLTAVVDDDERAAPAASGRTMVWERSLTSA